MEREARCSPWRSWRRRPTTSPLTERSVMAASALCTREHFPTGERWPSSTKARTQCRAPGRVPIRGHILPTLRHRHIIRLLGWCVAEKENSLVYEYMKNGSLHDHLHGGAPSSSSPSPVTTSWRKRMEILLGISRAIEYLHSHAVTPVIHRDVKASNILLDDTWAPRLADFGLSLKISWDDVKGRNAPVMGTSGYADPEYISTRSLTLAMDVYSFGVVMLEVLTGKTATLVSNNKNSLVSFALPKIEAKKLEEVLDRRPAQKPTPRQLQAADLVAATAARCLCLQGKKRPAIPEVVAELKTAFELVCCDG